MLKDFEFPELEPEKNRKRTLSEALEDEVEASAPLLAPEQRFVSVDDDGVDIDIALFPALRAALSLTEDDGEGEPAGSEPEELSGEADGTEVEPEEPVSEEEPIPSIFAGIGRTDWSTPVERPDEKRAEAFDGDSLPLEVIDAEPDEEEEKEPEICEFDLLDMIDDIEFSDLEPEALKPIRIRQLMSDPYNSRFNSVEDEDDGQEPDEMPVSPKFIFEKK